MKSESEVAQACLTLSDPFLNVVGVQGWAGYSGDGMEGRRGFEWEGVRVGMDERQLRRGPLR